MSEFDDVMFAEKDAAREPATARVGVGQTPVFVWLDASGAELGRFQTAESPESFRALVEEKRAGR
jgi:hypothetical protein